MNLIQWYNNRKLNKLLQKPNSIYLVVYTSEYRPKITATNWYEKMVWSNLAEISGYRHKYYCGHIKEIRTFVKLGIKPEIDVEIQAFRSIKDAYKSVVDKDERFKHYKVLEFDCGYDVQTLSEICLICERQYTCSTSNTSYRTNSLSLMGVCCEPPDESDWRTNSYSRFCPVYCKVKLH